MKCIRTKNGEVYNLESKEVSSWEYIDNDTAINEYGVEGAFYTIYYFDENKGHYSEHDGKGGHSCVFIDEKDILKQADTIKELCDVFVYEYKNSFYKNSKPSYELVDMSLESMKATMELFSGATFYGAIWTEWGLKYVAKMNEEGDLIRYEVLHN